MVIYQYFKSNLYPFRYSALATGDSHSIVAAN